MRYALIADIHSNIEALTAVFERINSETVDEVICLGDVVGYHANPNECVSSLRERGVRCIAGNHDRVAAGLKEPANFGEAARRAVLWTRSNLTQESVTFLRELPTFEVIAGSFLVVHAGVHPKPNEDVRLNSNYDVSKSLEAMARLFPEVRLCFVGHAHRSVVYEFRDQTLTCVKGPRAKTAKVALASSATYLVNPGSVGQSRDGDPTAAFLVFDDNDRTLNFHRVEYDWESCYRKAERAGLIYRETRLRKSVNWVTSRIAAGENVLKRNVARRFS